MSHRVADMTVEELRETIRDVVQEDLDEDEILTDEFAAELEERFKSPDLVDAETVWNFEMTNLAETGMDSYLQDLDKYESKLARGELSH